MDNDAYGHVNNVTYYSYFDTAVNEHLIRRAASTSAVRRSSESSSDVVPVPSFAVLSRRHRRRAAGSETRHVVGRSRDRAVSRE
jgi:hypothetical protein